MTKRAKCVFQLVVAYSYSLDQQFSTLTLTLLLQFYILISCEAHFNVKGAQNIFNKWTKFLSRCTCGTLGPGAFQLPWWYK